MSYETILTAIHERVLRITLNRPDRRNALDARMKSELLAALHDAESSDDVGCIVIRGAGPSFCSGHDFADLAGAQRDAAPQTPLDIFLDTQRAPDPWGPLWNLTKPTLAQLHGHCVGGGTELAFNCDVVIAADDARIGYPPVRAQGSTGPTHMWTYLVGPQWAKILMLTGDLIDGATAASIGLVARAVPAAELDAAVGRLAGRMARVPHELQAANKAICNKALELMGRDQLQRLQLQTDRFAYEGRAAAEWKRRLLEDGPREAVRWRDEGFE